MRLLSGGMKRRVLVAQALVHKPPVIMLDEPTAGVDIEMRRHYGISSNNWTEEATPLYWLHIIWKKLKRYAVV